MELTLLTKSFLGAVGVLAAPPPISNLLKLNNTQWVNIHARPLAGVSHCAFDPNSFSPFWPSA